MKKTAILFLVLAIIFSLFGCLNKSKIEEKKVTTVETKPALEDSMHSDSAEEILDRHIDLAGIPIIYLDTIKQQMIDKMICDPSARPNILVLEGLGANENSYFQSSTNWNDEYSFNRLHFYKAYFLDSRNKPFAGLRIEIFFANTSKEKANSLIDTLKANDSYEFNYSIQYFECSDGSYITNLSLTY